jgi:hypothetical protein
MLQRIQTLYLFTCALLAVILLKGKILVFSNKAGILYYLNMSGFWKITDAGTINIEKLLPVTIVMISIPIILAISIFLFKYRSLQMILVIFAILATSLLTVFIILFCLRNLPEKDLEMKFNILMPIPILIIALSVLAYRNIRKDENLVRSFDRVR